MQFSTKVEIVIGLAVVLGVWIASKTIEGLYSTREKKTPHEVSPRWKG